jgi:deoxyadenosine/deoxycytidine kinase
MADYLTAEEAYNAAIDKLNALEQAIVDICDIDTVHAIQARKKVIQTR